MRAEKKPFASSGEANSHPSLAWSSTLVKSQPQPIMIDPSNTQQTSTLISVFFTSCIAHKSPRQVMVSFGLTKQQSLTTLTRPTWRWRSGRPVSGTLRRSYRWFWESWTYPVVKVRGHVGCAKHTTISLLYQTYHYQKNHSLLLIMTPFIETTTTGIKYIIYCILLT